MIERREIAGAVVVIGTDASEVGRALHDASSDGAIRVLAFVGASDDPSLAEMLAELASEPLPAPGTSGNDGS